MKIERLIIIGLSIITISTMYIRVSERPARITSLVDQSISKCQSRIDVEKIFPDKKKVWLQVGTWLNPIEAPGDTGIVGFEPDFNTVAEVNKKKRKDLYMVPAAVSNISGIATFGSGINAGQSSSLNVNAFPCPTVLIYFLVPLDPHLNV